MQGIVDCGQASFLYYNENMFVWSAIREVCAELISTDAFGKFRELCDWGVFNTIGDEHCQSEWGDFVQSCNPEDEDIALDDYELKLAFKTTLNKSQLMSALDALRLTS